MYLDMVIKYVVLLFLQDVTKPQELPSEVLNFERLQTSTLCFGVQRATEIIQDNMGFKYKNKNTEIKM